MGNVINLSGGGGGGIRLSSISIATPPAKTAYKAGEIFNPAGMVVNAVYNNGAVAQVTGYSFEPSTPLAAGATSVTIRYSEGGVSKTATQAITCTKTSLTVPSQNNSLTYSGGSQSPTWNNYDSSKMTLGGTTSGTNAGSYNATFELSDTSLYQWSDGTTGRKTVQWSIAKASGSSSINKSSIDLSPSKLTDTITVTRSGTGAITAQSSDTSVATVSVSGNVVTVSSVNGKSGSATIMIKVAADTNYTAPSDKTCAVTAAFVSVYGVCWNYNNSSTALTRLTQSTDPNGYVNTNITTNPSPAVGTGAGSSPFDNLAPWSGMEEYNIVNNAVGAKKGQSGFSRTSNDTVVFIPEYYYKIVDDSANSKRYFYVANAPTTGFTKHPGSGKYVGKYNTVSGNYSKSGAAPYVNMTRATARTGATGKGSKWCLYDYASWCAVWLLYLVEFADWNSQAKIGRGVVDASAAVNSGGTDSMTYHTGRASGTDGQVSVQYRGIENPWGNVYEWIDGINFSNRKAYVCTDKSKYADDTSTGYTDSGITLPSSGWIKKLGMSSGFQWAFLPDTNGGSETTYVPDYVYSYTSWRVLYVGGYWDDAGNAGLFYFDADDGSSCAYAYIGARLLFNP